MTTKRANTKKTDLILRNGAVWIRKGSVPKQTLESRYHVDLFDERACTKCSNRPYRLNDLCLACPALQGQYDFMKDVTTKKGEKFSVVPAADLAWIESQFGRAGPKIKDKREAPPMRSKLKFTGKLFGKNAVDEKGNPRADQEKLAREWLVDKRGIVQAAPRAGKTVLAAYLACELGVRTLWMADRFELLDQAYATFMGDDDMDRSSVTNARKIEDRKGKPGYVVERVKNLKQLKASKADIVLINPQKAYLEKNMKAFAAAVEGKFGLFIGDELHGANAKRYAQVVSHVDAPYSLGLTATPHRKDGRDKIMSLVVGPITAVSEVTTLTPTIHAFFSKSVPPTSYSSWSPAMAWVAKDVTRNKEIVDLVFKDLAAGHRSILVPVNYKAHMVTLVDMINKEAKRRGLKRDLALGFHAKADRQMILKRANGGKRKTVTVAIMSIVKQGIDLKACSSVIMPIPMSATSGVGAPMFRQLSFRCATPLVGKKDPKVTIMVDNMIMFRGSLIGLYWQEIIPRTKGKQALYKVDPQSNALLSTMTRGVPKLSKARTSWTRTK